MAVMINNRNTASWVRGGRVTTRRGKTTTCLSLYRRLYLPNILCRAVTHSRPQDHRTKYKERNSKHFILSSFIFLPWARL